MSEIEIRMWAIEKAHEFYGNDLGRLLLVAEALFRMVWSGKPVMLDNKTHEVDFDLLLEDMKIRRPESRKSAATGSRNERTPDGEGA